MQRKQIEPREGLVNYEKMGVMYVNKTSSGWTYKNYIPITHYSNGSNIRTIDSESRALSPIGCKFYEPTELETLMYEQSLQQNRHLSFEELIVPFGIKTKTGEFVIIAYGSHKENPVLDESLRKVIEKLSPDEEVYSKYLPKIFKIKDLLKK